MWVRGGGVGKKIMTAVSLTSNKNEFLPQEQNCELDEGYQRTRLKQKKDGKRREQEDCLEGEKRVSTQCAA